MARSMAVRATTRYSGSKSRTPSPVTGGLHSKKRKAMNLKSTKMAPAGMSMGAAIAKGK